MMGLIERFCFFRRLSLLRITFALCFVVSFFFISSLLKVTPSRDSPPIFYFAKTNETNEIDDFRREWLRQHRARSDWQAIIKPCYDNMAWGKVKAGWGKVNRTNAFTSKIIFQDIRPAEEYSKIFIQSKTSDNRTKVIGGDTWRVHVHVHTWRVHQALRPLFLITTMELMRLCFLLWSLVSTSCQFIWIIVYVMDSRTLHVTGSLKGTLKANIRSFRPSG